MSYVSKRIRGNGRSRGDRGATLVEYTLVVSLVVVGSVSSLEGLDGQLEKHYAESAADIGQASVHAFDVPTTTLDQSTTTTSTTTSTTSTAPPTSSTTTTSTTTPPTTTTGGNSPPPTTTVPGAETATMFTRNWSGYYGDYWKWDVYGRLKFRNEAGNNLSYAAIEYTITLANGDQQSFSGTADDRGRLIVDWAFQDSDDIFPATITVTSVSKSGNSYNPSPAQVSWGDTG